MRTTKNTDKGRQERASLGSESPCLLIFVNHFLKKKVFKLCKKISPRNSRRDFFQKVFPSIILTIVFLVFLGGMASAQERFDPALKWRTIKSAHFFVHYHEGLENEARKAGAIAEEVHTRLSAKMGWEPKTKTHLVISDVSDFSNGFSWIFPYPKIIIFVAPPSSDDSLDNYDDWLRTLITHEYTHILVMDMTGGVPALLRALFGRAVSMNAFVPAWWSEGFSMYEETVGTSAGRGRSAYLDMELRAVVLEGKFPSPGEADAGVLRWPGGETPYLFGVGFVSYLTERFGEEKIYRFLRQYSRQAIPFLMNDTARKIFGSTMTDLWRDWEGYLKKKYQTQAEEVKREGLIEGRQITKLGDWTAYPIFDPTRKALYFFNANSHTGGALYVYEQSSQSVRRIGGFQTVSNFTISPDGERLVYSKIIPPFRETSSMYYHYTDLYVKSLDKKESLLAYLANRLTEDERALDPDFSSDGKKVVYVSRKGATSELKIISVESKEVEVLFTPPSYSMMNTPRWSPDGSKIVFSMHTGGERDIWLIDVNSGKSVTRVTQDSARDVDPSWSPDGRYILFSSDRSGIPNIYAYDTQNRGFHKITNVFTGAFQPTVASDGLMLFYQGYTSRGFDLYEMAFNPSNWKETQFYSTAGSNQPPVSPLQDASRAYNPLPSLAPRYLMPVFWYDGVDYQVGLSTGGTDPLNEHAWSAFARWGSASEFLSWGASYLNEQTKFSLLAYHQQYAVSYGEILLSAGDFNGDGVISIPAELYYLDDRYFEKRQESAFGVSYRLGSFAISAGYSYEERKNLTSISGLIFDSLLPDRGNFAGVWTQISLGTVAFFPYSISPEAGQSLTFSFEWLDSAFGSDYEQRIYIADIRTYIPVPFLKHHVLALRTAGGMMEGDKLFQGTFRMGGTLGESIISNPGNKYFYLRGFETNRFLGDKALLISGEYRFPIAYPQRFPKMLPIFFQKIHGAFFADYGGAFDRKNRYPLTVGGTTLINPSTGQPIYVEFEENDEWNLGVGAELRITGFLGWGMIAPPLTARFGVAHDIQGDGIGPVFYFDIGTPF